MMQISPKLAKADHSKNEIRGDYADDGRRRVLPRQALRLAQMCESPMAGRAAELARAAARCWLMISADSPRRAAMRLPKAIIMRNPAAAAACAGYGGDVMISHGFDFWPAR